MHNHYNFKRFSSYCNYASLLISHKSEMVKRSSSHFFPITIWDQQLYRLRQLSILFPLYNRKVARKPMDRLWPWRSLGGSPECHWALGWYVTSVCRWCVPRRNCLVSLSGSICNSRFLSQQIRHQSTRLASILHIREQHHNTW